jgi:hypothetical protein
LEFRNHRHYRMLISHQKNSLSSILHKKGRITQFIKVHSPQLFCSILSTHSRHPLHIFKRKFVNKLRWKVFRHFLKEFSLSSFTSSNKKNFSSFFSLFFAHNQDNKEWNESKVYQHEKNKKSFQSFCCCCCWTFFFSFYALCCSINSSAHEALTVGAEIKANLFL